jgi:predicted ATPase
MKISIKNFKAIESLDDFELKDINILSGINSCGKTSLIQFLLLIKQTIESREDDNTLILNKPYIELGKFLDIINGRDIKKPLSFKIIISKEEIYLPGIAIGKSLEGILYNKEDFQSLELEIKFLYSEELKKINLSHFNLTLFFKESDSLDIEPSEQDIYFHLSLNEDNRTYSVEYNSEIFFYYRFKAIQASKLDFVEAADSYLDSDIDEYTIISPRPAYSGVVEFNNIYPRLIRIENSSEPLQLLSELFDNLYTYLRDYFYNMSYIGPLREAPHTYYIDNDEVKLRIGNKGEYTAQILSQEAKNPVEYFKKNEIEQKIEKVNSTLVQAVNYWICEFFSLAKEIKSEVQDEENRVFKILLTNANGLIVPITHVGFGVSQILPVVVEGLRMPANSILILEQPEIHLHPKLQSLLMDFLIYLNYSGKKVLIETHSDHIITRLRRRVVEDLSDSLIKKVNLCFIEQGTEKKLFNQLQLNELGTFKKWPKDFFDQLQNEHQEIVLAQSRKRIKARGNQV